MSVFFAVIELVLRDQSGVKGCFVSIALFGDTGGEWQVVLST